MAAIDLYPTKTRLLLLDEVHAGDVFRDAIDESHISGYVKVTGRIAELEQAGWVRLAEVSPNGLRYWRLTDAGTAVLAESAVT